MRRIALWTLLALSLSANVAVAAIALGREAAPRAMPREPLLFSKVSLDPDQRARVLVLREKLLADGREQAGRLAALRGTLADQLAQDGADPHAIEGTLAAIEAAQAGFQRRVVAHVLAVREVLRPEQRPAFLALVERHMRAGTPLDPAAHPVPDSGGLP
jgi:Spy/CpxP family protein refolding chaperone